MIGSLLFLRIIADYLWGYKLISVLSVVVMAAMLMIYGIARGAFSSRLSISKPFSLFLVSVTVAYFLNIENSTLDDFLKFLSYFSLFCLAGLVRPRLTGSKFIVGFSLAALSCLSFAAAVGIGYQYWGSINTFYGGYFFKTDVAIAALIFLALACVAAKGPSVVILCSLLCGYVVFRADSRIALPLVFIFPALALGVRTGMLREVSMRGGLFFIVAMVAGLALLYVYSLLGENFLGFDFSDPFSNANTQGRMAIWTALLDFYFESSWLHKILGSGLSADSIATIRFVMGSQLEGVRAHNSFLWILLCTGGGGLLLFVAVIWQNVRKSLLVVKYGEEPEVSVAALCLLFWVLFLWVSLTTEAVIRPQVMIPLFLLSGVVYRIPVRRPCSVSA